ncbi:MAG: phosphodiester glycosidase family protein [Candidatus Kapabacteria bacterium]|nr:phosphodiester glycosidase family protein [Candidatus Kapabacteria bacterium]
MITSYRIVTTILIVCAITFGIVPNPSIEAKPRKKGTVRVKGAKAKKGGKRSRTHRSSKKARRAANNQQVAQTQAKKMITSVAIIDDSLLTEGLIYRKMDVMFKDSTHSIAHTLTCVTKNPQFSIQALKAEGVAFGMERIPTMMARLDSAENRKVLAAINTHFWRTPSYTPLGATVVNGEVVEMLPNKNWTSCFIDTKGKPHFDSLKISAIVRTRGGITLPVSAVNRRTASDSCILFNQYAGTTVPPVMLRRIERMIDEIQADSATLSTDSTIAPAQINRDSLRSILAKQMQETSAEREYKKILVRYLRPPQINTDIPMIVLDVVDTGTVQIPLRGCVLSMSSQIAKTMYFTVGDTLYLRYTTNVLDSVQFVQSFCGVPKLVSSGKQNDLLNNSEYLNPYFSQGKLARTAIGTDILRSTLYLCSIESNSRSRGMSLAELAEFMKGFGAHDAINMDGGGSAQMVVGQSIVTHESNQFVRKISVALGVVKKKLLPKLPRGHQKE